MEYPIKHSMLDVGFLLKIESGEITEDLTIDFKVVPYTLKLRDEIKNFLRDISAMLNGLGGVICLGVSDDGQLEGVSIPDTDLYKRQILSIISSNIEPQIIGIDFKKIEYNGNEYLIILVPNGESKPYSIRMSGTDSREFLIRQNAGNHHLSMSEIRKMFLKEELSKENNETWKTWKKEKLDKVIQDNWIKPLHSVTSILTLVTPMDSKPDDVIMDVTKLKSLGDKNNLIFAPHSNGRTLSPFHQGVYAEDSGRDHKCFSYVVVEENMSFQYYDALILGNIKESLRIEQEIDIHITSNIANAFKFLDDAGFKNSKYQVSVFFINAKGAKLFFRYTTPGPVMNALGIPSDACEFKTIITVGEDVLKGVRPIFDKLWQTSGQPRCKRYNEDGEFNGVVSDY